MKYHWKGQISRFSHWMFRHSYKMVIYFRYIVDNDSHNLWLHYLLTISNCSWGGHAFRPLDCWCAIDVWLIHNPRETCFTQKVTTLLKKNPPLWTLAIVTDLQNTFPDIIVLLTSTLFNIIRHGLFHAGPLPALEQP